MFFFSSSSIYLFEEKKIEWKTFRVIIRLKMCSCRPCRPRWKEIDSISARDSHLPIHVFTFNFAIFLFIACRLSFLSIIVPASWEVCCVVVVGCGGNLTDCAFALMAATATLCSRTSYYYRPLSGTMYYLMSCHSMKWIWIPCNLVVVSFLLLILGALNLAREKRYGNCVSRMTRHIEI